MIFEIRDSHNLITGHWDSEKELFTAIPFKKKGVPVRQRSWRVVDIRGLEPIVFDNEHDVRVFNGIRTDISQLRTVSQGEDRHEVFIPAGYKPAATLVERPKPVKTPGHTMDLKDWLE